MSHLGVTLRTSSVAEMFPTGSNSWAEVAVQVGEGDGLGLGFGVGDVVNAGIVTVVTVPVHVTAPLVAISTGAKFWSATLRM